MHSIYFPTLILIIFVSNVLSVEQANHFIDQSVTQLTNSNFHQITQISLPFKDSKKFSKDWFIIFYSPQCPHCQKAMPEWNSLAKQIVQQQKKNNYANLRIGAINCITEQKLCEKFYVDGFPTFFFLESPNISYQFTNYNRTKKQFLNFIKSNQKGRTIIEQKSHLEKISNFFHELSTTGIILLISIVFLSFCLIYVLFSQDQQEFTHQRIIHGETQLETFELNQNA